MWDLRALGPRSERPTPGRQNEHPEALPMNNFSWADELDLPDLDMPDPRWPHGVNEISVHLSRKFPLTYREDTFMLKLFQISKAGWDHLHPELQQLVRLYVQQYSATLQASSATSTPAEGVVPLEP